MIHILIRYLGIKTKLLDVIKEKILTNTKENSVVLDLFGGSNIVADALTNERVVYTNDIQKYSYISAKALMEQVDNKILNNLSLEKIIDSKYFNENFAYLSEIFSKPLKEEQDVIEKCSSSIKDGKVEINDDIMKFKLFYENEPYVNNFNRTIKSFNGLSKFYTKEYYEHLQENKENECYCLFTILFAMPYFTLNQSIYIDSFRYAIDKLLEENQITDKEYSIYLSSLIYLLQNIVTSVGDHFAQPQKFKVIDEPKYHKEMIKIINKKNLDLNKCISEKIKEFKNSTAITKDNRCFNLDFMDLLNNFDIMEKVDAIYMDPPYTNAHYSRFYHILETLVEYNYPDFSYNGRYSKERIQSPFCIRSKAKQAFYEMIKISSEYGKTLFISYSDTKQCIITKNELLEICNLFYNDIEIGETDYLYRNLGQKPNKVKGNELLIICRC